MAPKKTTSPTAANASAADYFTRGKKPTTIDRVIGTKETVVTAPSPPTSNHNNNKFTTEQKRQALKRNRKRILQDTVIVISDDNDNVDDKEEKKEETNKDNSTTTTATVTHARVDASNDDKDAVFNGEDFGPLDGYHFDDSFESQSPQRQSQRQLQPQIKLPMVTSILEPLTRSELQPQIKLPMLTEIMEPLTTAPMPGALSTQQSHSHVRVIPVDIKKGIHQDDISEQEKMLRQFDLSSKYGPCLNMTRLKRWERAHRLGLAPPMDIKDVLVKNAILNTPLFSGRV